MIRVLQDNERLQWFQLSRCEQVGPVLFSRLLEQYGSATEALAALQSGDALQKKVGSIKGTLEKAQQEYGKLLAMGASIIAACEPAYPALLREIHDAPPVLTVFGKKALLQQPMVAIVGSRNASTHGCLFAKKIAKELGEQGWAVSSGLARGIDTAAHKGAVALGTVGVVAGGIDIVYPPENKMLYEHMKKEAAIIAEMPLGTLPKPHYFPRRNRIIAGMSQGIVVVEAGIHSGSLITARMALDYNREVFAVPAFPLDPRSRGTNRLLKEGAHVVESAEDIMRILSASPFQEKKEVPYASSVTGTVVLPGEEGFESIKALVLQKLSVEPLPIDILVVASHKPAATILAAVSELELAGKLQRCMGNKVALCCEI